MGDRGPKPKPTKLRQLHGDKPSRINTAEPVPSKTDVVCPVDLPPPAHEIWDRLAPDLIRTGVLTAWDVDLFATFCQLLALHRAALEECFDAKGAPMPTVEGDRGQVKNPAVQIARDTTQVLISLSGRYGLTPSDRAELKIGGEHGDQGAERLLS